MGISHIYRQKLEKEEAKNLGGLGGKEELKGRGGGGVDKKKAGPGRRGIEIGIEMRVIMGEDGKNLLQFSHLICVNIIKVYCNLNKNNVKGHMEKFLKMYLQAIEIENTCCTTVDAESHLHLWEDLSKNSSQLRSTNGYLSDELFSIVSLILIYTIQISNISALIGNSLNIAVFIKLGFSEPSNISLTVLAISDFALVILSVWSSLCFLLTYNNILLPFHTINVSFLTGGNPWAFLSRTIAWITAFISFERCLCILMPLKVKRLIIPRSTSAAMLIITLLTFGPFLFTYLRYNFVWVFYPYLNTTILDIMPNENEHFALMEKIVTIICGVVQPIVAFLFVLISTVFLIVQLRKISFWRKSVTSTKSQLENKSGGNLAPAAQNRISQKEVRLVRMVVVIATIFIVTYTPTCIMLLCTVVLDEFSLFGIYRKTFIICGFITVLGHSVNGSVNIVIYYNMASKFRLCLRRLLRLDH
ncbi:chemosensory receptor b [Plakobranchus ocellatus]|uniref:Chemosensory receptor b n=1 Tax=Plakobranchus ocellatus TaxID=259542 RepID=A0AAV4CDZ3_9GAST|nr:chemosensory receptor b [Plakobranchus ocellatus]